MNILVTICARGGSKGVPGKNIRKLAGLPLLHYSLNHARLFAEKYNAHIVLSTDSDDIAKVAEAFGLPTEYRRPIELAQDHSGKVDALKHVLGYMENKGQLKYDYLLDLDVTAPLRTLEDLDTAFQVLLKDENAYNIFSVSEPHRSPYFNQVEKKENGYYDLVKPLGNIVSRQQGPKVYDMNASFYIYRRFFFTNEFVKPVTQKSLIYLMPHICFDIDNETDFLMMDYLVANNKLGFKI